MRFDEWMRISLINATDVAERLGVSDSFLSQCLNGKKWPSARVLIASIQMSAGRVTLADWYEVCRPLLQESGVIKEGEKLHVENRRGVPGRRPKARKAPKEQGHPAG